MSLVTFQWASAQTNPDYWQFTPKPLPGWNSWDIFGTTALPLVPFIQVLKLKETVFASVSQVQGQDSRQKLLGIVSKDLKSARISILK